SAFRIAHARRRHLRPEEFSVAPDESLLDRIAVDLSGKLAVEFRAILFDVLRMRLIEDGAAQQLGGGVSRQFRRILVHAKDPPVLIDFDNTGPDMLVARRSPEP